MPHQDDWKYEGARHLSGKWGQTFPFCRLTPSGRMAGELIDAGAKDWNTSSGMLLLMWSAPVALITITLTCAIIGKDLYFFLLEEDSIYEWLQVCLLATTFVLAISVTRHLFSTRQSVLATLYVLFVVGVFVLLGEEISWGQRILGIETPPSLRAINRQDEFNVHNIRGVQGAFHWVLFVISAYGTFLPILNSVSKSWARFKKQNEFLIPHLSIVPYFGIVFTWRVYRNFFERPEKYSKAISGFNEAIEVVLYAGFALSMLYMTNS